MSLVEFGAFYLIDCEPAISTCTRHAQHEARLELYAYNLIRTASPAIEDWVHTRGYVAHQAGNRDVPALLDIYLLLGPQAMASALRAAQAHAPRYGEPLSPAVRQAFIAVAPDRIKQQVATRIAAVSF